MTAGSFSLASARVAEMSLQRELRALGADITLSLEQLDAPISLADAAGFVRWQNAAAIELVGDKRGTRFTSMAPDYVQQTRASLARPGDLETVAGAPARSGRGSRPASSRGRSDPP